MPTVLRFDGLRVVIYPADHRPAHVHVIGSQGEAVFVLGCSGGYTELRENHGFPGHEVRRISKVLDQHKEALCGQWRQIHGDD
ncbi:MULTISPECIES: DUF4160 domain-containing protein [Ectothiorhodospira]|uniref:DUF4160 domain-containing protein n=1 Tax=Ectothiorhodospira TaxID=1051 RepID=UPI000A0168A4|nr:MULTISPECIES: DUF4160 domain-containing protein [Ectothiorhodospira]MCG5495366.1 DUF4160 domain-containing protein [Ectothiorhodospira variabilis]MCG5498789.1 DUF4160 domain-containing protein [Ectothiorhodospira variabilis]MCG5504964.1 DUF4160 domain-containing protein [Ectothiorhodospira variabilis]MCG5508121.1 DUF4160 domain-containing protein [Ectothiorhodospira variabilis]MCG5524308.1 DUF4160 domain-containing protein [Ectothiorhodospira haloalkaliphila]